MAQDPKKRTQPDDPLRTQPDDPLNPVRERLQMSKELMQLHKMRQELERQDVENSMARELAQTNEFAQRAQRDMIAQQTGVQIDDPFKELEINTLGAGLGSSVPGQFGQGFEQFQTSEMQKIRDSIQLSQKSLEKARRNMLQAVQEHGAQRSTTGLGSLVAFPLDLVGGLVGQRDLGQGLLGSADPARQRAARVLQSQMRQRFELNDIERDTARLQFLEQMQQAEDLAQFRAQQDLLEQQIRHQFTRERDQFRNLAAQEDARIEAQEKREKKLQTQTPGFSLEQNLFAQRMLNETNVPSSVADLMNALATRGRGAGAFLTSDFIESDERIAALADRAAVDLIEEGREGLLTPGEEGQAPPMINEISRILLDSDTPSDRSAAFSRDKLFGALQPAESLIRERLQIRKKEAEIAEKEQEIKRLQKQAEIGVQFGRGPQPFLGDPARQPMISMSRELERARAELQKLQNELIKLEQGEQIK